MQIRSVLHALLLSYFNIEINNSRGFLVWRLLLLLLLFSVAVAVVVEVVVVVVVEEVVVVVCLL